MGITDLFSALIFLKYRFHFPGLDSLTHAVDIQTGDINPNPLFSFNYCDNTSLGIVEDVFRYSCCSYCVLTLSFRGLTYTVPKEVFAQIDNQCAFSLDSNTYTSSSQMSQEMSQSSCRFSQIFVVFYFNIFCSFFCGSKSFCQVWIYRRGCLLIFLSGIGVTRSQLFTPKQDQTVSTARSMENTQSGSLITTQVKCQTAKVQMAQYSFHPQFVKYVLFPPNSYLMTLLFCRDVAFAWNATAMLAVIRKYGSHYYKRLL